MLKERSDAGRERMKNKVLFAYKNDIKGMDTRWQFYHIFREPPHKYEGHVILGRNSLKLRADELEVNILHKNIKDLRMVFDETFKRRTSIFRPVRIRYQTNGGEDTVYLFVGFHKAMYFFSLRAWPIPKTENKAWLNALKRKLTEKC